MPAARPRPRAERGIALPTALLLLVCLGFIATAASFLSTTDLQISSGFSAGNNAVATAEAALEHGIVELSNRARAGEDPDGVAILSDSLGTFGYTVTAFTKREHAGGGGRDFNGDGDQTDVVRYDQSFGYAEANASGAPGDEGAPVKQLVAVATSGRSRAEVRAEVAHERLRPELNSPMSLNSASNAVLNGSFEVDGRLHTRAGALVASGTLTPAYGPDAGSKAAAKSECSYWKPGIKIPSEGALDLTGSMNSTGHVAFDHPDGGETQNYDAEDPLSSMKFTPEELLGLDPGDLDAYKRDASAIPDFGNLSGINYVSSGSVPSQIGGSGILIVHNPNFDPRKSDCTNFPGTCIAGYGSDPANEPMTLRINGNGSFKGIIIVDELQRLNGNFSMLGALASLTTTPIDIPANGSGSLKWSCEAIQDALNQASSYGVRLSWEHRM